MSENIRHWTQNGAVMISAVVEALPAERQAQLRELVENGHELVAVTDGARTFVALVSPAALASATLWSVDTTCEPPAVDRVTLQ